MKHFKILSNILKPLHFKKYTLFVLFYLSLQFLLQRMLTKIASIIGNNIKKCAEVNQRNNLPTFIYYLRLYLDIS